MATISNAARSDAANAVTALVNGGFLRIYDGTPPADVNASLSGNTLLAELTFGSPAFGAASNGVATANAIGQDSSADASGSAAFYRATTSGGTPVWQGTVGTSGAELNLNSVDIVAGGIVSVSALTYTQAAGS
jgi:hypothetical protein